MTYEEHLDEVATLLTEIYTLSDEVAIGIVMRAQLRMPCFSICASQFCGWGGSNGVDARTMVFTR